MNLTELFFNFLIQLVKKYSWSGVFVSMILESACLPVPSEIVMPLTGFTLCSDIASILYATFIVTVANLIGSWLSYLAGLYGGRSFILKYGKYFFINIKEFSKGEELFRRYGEIAVLIGRMLPIIRTLISLPAGIFNMNPFKFTILTILGSIPWNFTLIFIGFKLNENWSLLADYLKFFDYIVILLLAIFFIFLLYNQHVKRKIVRSK
ncbi:MAG: DedA family protein [Candidatus Methanomethylicota archaeon]|nr:MAG: DedA family protein [Candidatus Verstraetearchaeota archaeon]